MNRDIMRNGNIGQRTGWIKKRDQIKELLPHIETMVLQLGKLRFEKRRNANIEPHVVSGQVSYFRSKLKFAACLFYGKSSAITVFPTTGDLHRMGITHLKEDKASDDAPTVRLVEAAEASRNKEGYSINVLTELLDVAAGVLAMSPNSYCLLSEEEQLRIGEIVASIANADMMADILNSVA